MIINHWMERGKDISSKLLGIKQHYHQQQGYVTICHHQKMVLTQTKMMPCYIGFWGFPTSGDDCRGKKQ